MDSALDSRDATRVKEYCLVCMKVAVSQNKQSEALTSLSAECLLNDAANHWLPVLAVLQDERYCDDTYAITSFLRPLCNPGFEPIVGVMVNSIDPILEVST